MLNVSLDDRPACSIAETCIVSCPSRRQIANALPAGHIAGYECGSRRLVSAQNLSTCLAPPEKRSA